MRNRIFEIIEISKENDTISRAYDLLMMAVIVLSLVPLASKHDTAIFSYIDKATVSFFILDYVLRIFTADIKMGKGIMSFFLYPFSPMAIIDLVSILPSFTGIANGFRLLKIFRLIRTLRVFRAFRSFRYSKSVSIISDVIKEQKEPLLAVCSLSIGYILISALIVFNVEPETFNNFFDAVYWAAVSLTTVGYGDIYPVTTAGRIITMISSFIGIAIVALPAGIITAGYMDRINRNDSSEK